MAMELQQQQLYVTSNWLWDKLYQIYKVEFSFSWFFDLPVVSFTGDSRTVN
jgi:hypothetical protein